MSEQVKIKDESAEGGFRLLDRGEFIEGVHLLFEEPAAAPGAENSHLPDDFKQRLDELSTLEQLKRPALTEVAARYNVKPTPGMSNVALVAALRAAAGYTPDPSAGGAQGRPEEPLVKVKYVMMRRTTDGDGPHPIHPDEVENYKKGEWVVVEDEPQQ